MANDYADLAKALLSGPSAGKALKNLDKVAALLGKPEGQALLKQLASGGGDALKKAAADAADGQTDAAKTLLNSLMTDPEGAALLKQILALAKA